MYEDTIAAISTPIGEGGIGIIRLSGKNSQPIAEKLFTSKLSNHHISYGHIIDPNDNSIIDEVLVSFMAAPHSYTREDVIEINCHGGPLPLQHILELTLRYGARLAEPGEFTLRAFLNGRIDLAQAEAVLDVIRARTQSSLRVAIQGLEGYLSTEVKRIRSQLMSALSYLTARIDFPEDEIEPQDILQLMADSLQNLQQLLNTADAGIIYRQGVRIAIVGCPNVGKSTLLNHLLQQDRAIVAPTPGTTRDTIEESVNIRGIPFVLVDTAGILHSNDPVESLGVGRSRKAIEQSDLVLLVLDVSEPMTDADREIISYLRGKAVVVAANKCDLPHRTENLSLPWEAIMTSALTGEGISILEDKIADTVLQGKVFAPDTLLVSNTRHKDALQRAKLSLEQVFSDIESGIPDDFITISLTEAVNALGEITGETIREELLETIFANFCIGK